jgi:hypothetical protein
MISVSKVNSRADWRDFLHFPIRVYKEYPEWVPPVFSKQKRQLCPASGRFFNDGAGSTAEYFIARRSGEVVGRIAAIANETHRKTHRDGVGFFGFFESIDDERVAAALLAEAENWLAARRFFISRGPTSFTIYDPAGVTVFGGNTRPGMGMAYTPPYYERLLESRGYRKSRDLLAYRCTLDRARSARRRSSFAGLEENMDDLCIRSVKPHDRSDAGTIAGIFNLAWERNWGAIPMTADDFLHLQKEMGPFADPRLAYLASKDGKPVGFFIASLDPGEILQGTNGRVGPGALFKFVFGRKRIRLARVISLGVLPGHRNSSAVARLLFEFYRHWNEFPCLESLEFSWILEDNWPTRRLVEKIGGVHSHTFRVFERFL